ncbi:alkaline phosphatase [Mariniphaga anaerophila]|uniref:Alkaline phosphatase n=1 Tax=Mariniphaga anaerophila TaxID=1484053 RepID=A0A1M5E0I4_9BACT|nr:alkaline phosphatase [Mariniphaga anaerophila]SHF72778.1 alkaline phosphatase [Mariniphaga anaerophila]
MQKLISLMFALLLGLSSIAQDEYLNAEAEKSDKIYPGGEAYDVTIFPQKFRGKTPKNIILMISDGMGLTHLNAALVANKGQLFLRNFHHIGFAETQSANKYTTDSSAAGTAIATGVRTNNGALGVDPDNNPVKSILEDAEGKGLATGLVSTSAITHATPASFIAHQPKRNMYEEIAADFLSTDIDVFIGGGCDHFTERKDGRNLVKELKKKEYKVEQDINKIEKVKKGKLAGLTAPVHNPAMPERGDMLPKATKTAVNILDNNKKGFFLMVEGSQVDWGGHAGSTVEVVQEMLDFDRAVGKALEFASKNRETLVIVTADHETGGMAILDGNFETGMVKGEFSTGSHTGIMVPILSWGPGAEEFTGFMKNTDIHDRMKKLLLGE